MFAATPFATLDIQQITDVLTPTFFEAIKFVPQLVEAKVSARGGRNELFCGDDLDELVQCIAIERWPLGEFSLQDLLGRSASKPAEQATCAEVVDRRFCGVKVDGIEVVVSQPQGNIVAANQCLFEAGQIANPATDSLSMGGDALLDMSAPFADILGIHARANDAGRQLVAELASRCAVAEAECLDHWVTLQQVEHRIAGVQRLGRNQHRSAPGYLVDRGGSNQMALAGSGWARDDSYWLAATT
jgi:hypothetical protein